MDKREQILVRIAAILEGLGFAFVRRNEIEVPESISPAAVLLDGDEEVRPGSYERKRPATGPLIVDMFPEVYVLTDDGATDVGPSLNVIRGRIVQAIVTDPQLTALSHDGDIRFNGMQTGLALGRSMRGEAGLMLQVAYVMYPGNLVPAATETES